MNSKVYKIYVEKNWHRLQPASFILTLTMEHTANISNDLYA